MYNQIIHAYHENRFSTSSLQQPTYPSRVWHVLIQRGMTGEEEKRNNHSHTLWQPRCRVDLSQWRKDVGTKWWHRWRSWGWKWPTSADRSTRQVVTRRTQTKQTAVGNPGSILRSSAMKTDNMKKSHQYLCNLKYEYNVWHTQINIIYKIKNQKGWLINKN